MKISIDTKEDSHDEIKKVIRMLQNLVGDSQEIFTNEPQEAAASPMANIFGDTSNTAQEQSSTEQTTQSTEGAQTQETEEAQSGEATQSTDDLFAELFSEEELKKMEAAPAKEEEKEEIEEEEEKEEKIKSKKKKYDIELY